MKNVAIATAGGILCVASLLLFIGVVLGIQGPKYRRFGTLGISFDSRGVITLISDSAGVVAYIAPVASIPLAIIGLVSGATAFGWLYFRLRRQRLRQVKRAQFAAGHAFPVVPPIERKR